MSNFITTIGKIAQVFDGPHATPEKTEFGPFFLSISSLENGTLDLSKSAHLSEKDFDKWTKRVTPQEGDVLFSYETRLGEAALMPAGIKACLGRRMGLLRADKTKVLPEFLLYAYLSPEFQETIRANTIHGATVDRIALKNLPNYPIRIPPLAEQIKVIAVLKSIYRKKELNTQTNQTLESIAQAIFKSWFVDFEPVKAKMAALAEGGTREQAELAAMGAISGKSEAELAQLQQQNPEHYQQLAETAALFPSAMVESELGEIPEGWEIGSIGDIALAKGGYAFKSNEFEATGNKVVKIKNITGDGRVDLTDCDCVKHPQPEKLDRFKITNGDLLMAMTGATVGKIGIAVSGNDYVYLNQRVAKFESKIQTKKVSWFLFPCIQQKSIFDTIVGSAQGSAQPNISSTEIERTEIVVPDENLISKYCDLVDPFFKKWMANNILNIELANLRDSLLPKLLSGEIDLSDIQSEVA